ncbi:HD-GYP domain-containing protein [Fervidobacterium thailandense]|uniref:HD-GYP domain-containing protein n=1 Tax=Fervidobacterium thailandense TaxID=1008305 RepID=UPI000A418EF8|nr:HD-GYP domain-containing protein [Fervidobacterium thailandense]
MAKTTVREFFKGSVLRMLLSVSTVTVFVFVVLLGIFVKRTENAISKMIYTQVKNQVSLVETAIRNFVEVYEESVHEVVSQMVNVLKNESQLDKKIVDTYVNVYLSYFTPPFEEISYEILESKEKKQQIDGQSSMIEFDTLTRRFYFRVFKKILGEKDIVLTFYLPSDTLDSYLKKIDFSDFSVINKLILLDSETMRAIFRIESRSKRNTFLISKTISYPGELKLFGRSLQIYVETCYEEIVSPLIALMSFVLFSILYLSLRISRYSNHLITEIEKIDNALSDFQNGTCRYDLYSDLVEIDKTLDTLRHTHELIFHQINELQNSNARIEELYTEVQELSKELRDAFFDFAQRLATVVEGFEEETAKHVYRTRALTELIVRRLDIPQDYKEEIVRYSTLHDIGKIFIPKELLNKPGKLSKEEFEEIKKHTIYAKRLLTHPRFKVALNIALFHHENYDGTGYPFGLVSDEIPLEARIVKIVDVYDALRSDRPYKKGVSHDTAIRIMTEGDGRVMPSHFDPELLNIFLSLEEDVKLLYQNTNIDALTL